VSEHRSLLPFLHGKRLLIFHRCDWTQVASCVFATHEYVPMKVGYVCSAPIVLPVPFQTGLDPTFTSSLLAAKCTTKIMRGLIHVLGPAVLVRAGEAVSPAVAKVLRLLDIRQELRGPGASVRLPRPDRCACSRLTRVPVPVAACSADGLLPAAALALPATLEGLLARVCDDVMAVARETGTVLRGRMLGVMQAADACSRAQAAAAEAERAAVAAALRRLEGDDDDELADLFG
jgi:hypothetical protein